MQLNYCDILVWTHYIFTISTVKMQGSRDTLDLILHYYVAYLHGKFSLRGFDSSASVNSPSPALHPFSLPHPPLPWCNIFGTALQSTSVLKLEELIAPGFGGLHCSYLQPSHARVAKKKLKGGNLECLVRKHG